MLTVDSRLCFPSSMATYRKIGAEGRRSKSCLAEGERPKSVTLLSRANTNLSDGFELVSGNSSGENVSCPG